MSKVEEACAYELVYNPRTAPLVTHLGDGHHANLPHLRVSFVYGLLECEGNGGGHQSVGLQLLSNRVEGTGCAGVRLASDWELK